MNKKTQRFVGIDPGKNGGISSVRTGEDGEIDWSTFTTCVMPEEASRVKREMQGGIFGCKTYIAIEKLTGFTRASGPDTMFKLGVEFGKVKCIAEIMWSMDKDIHLMYFVPQTWQKSVTTFKRKDFGTDTKWKNHLKERAALLIGEQAGIKPTLKTADSMLILYHLLSSKGLL